MDADHIVGKRGDSLDWTWVILAGIACAIFQYLS